MSRSAPDGTRKPPSARGRIRTLFQKVSKGFQRRNERARGDGTRTRDAAEGGARPPGPGAPSPTRPRGANAVTDAAGAGAEAETGAMAGTGTTAGTGNVRGDGVGAAAGAGVESGAGVRHRETRSTGLGTTRRNSVWTMEIPAGAVVRAWTSGRSTTNRSTGSPNRSIA